MPGQLKLSSITSIEPRDRFFGIQSSIIALTRRGRRRRTIIGRGGGRGGEG
jgi:hypothetical protein